MKEKIIILATTSPRRLEIFEFLGLPFDSRKHEFDERSVLINNPKEDIAKIAEGKAVSISKYYDSEKIIIGVDTVVVSSLGDVLGKPKDKKEAVEMIMGLSGKEHYIATGFCILGKNKKISGSEIVKIKFRNIDINEAVSYSELEKNILDIAGAYDHEHLGAIFVESIEGDFYSSIGMSLFKIANILNEEFLISPFG